jgi:hypothetical protein
VKRILSNKKAQVGETLTWMISTIIILVLLIIFVYSTLAFAKAKNIKTSSIDFGKADSSDKINWMNLKSEIAFSINDQNEKVIREWINEVKEE